MILLQTKHSKVRKKNQSEYLFKEVYTLYAPISDEFRGSAKSFISEESALIAPLTWEFRPRYIVELYTANKSTTFLQFSDGKKQERREGFTPYLAYESQA